MEREKTSKQNLTELRAKLRESRKEEAAKPRICGQCKKTFTVKPGDSGNISAVQKYCNDACRLAFYANKARRRPVVEDPLRYLSKDEMTHIEALIRKAGHAKLCKFLGISAAAVTRALRPNNLLIRESLISKLMACTLEQAPKKVTSKEAIARSKEALRRQDIYAVVSHVMQPKLLGRETMRSPNYNDE
jgi:hypothetical protein